MNTCLINGQAIASLAISDRAIHYGDGLFETLAIKHGVILYWSEHYQRLLNGCERLKISCPLEAVLLQEIDTVKSGNHQAVVKIILTRGNSERGYRIPLNTHTKRIVQAFPFPKIPKTYYLEGIRSLFCKTPVSENTYLAGMKHLNRLDNVLASSEWDETEFAEGLMCNAKLQVIQGTKSNVFYSKKGEMYTPDLSHAGILGIMRAQVLHWAAQNNIKVHIEPITQSALLQADEIFVCNSVVGIWPVRELEGHLFPVGEFTKQLIALRSDHG